MTRKMLLRISMGFLLALVGSWWAGSVTFSLVHAGRAPGRALAVWPVSEARSGVAATLIDGDDDAADQARAEALARAALAASPVNVEAARTLALTKAARGDIAGARALIRYAEQLSRRDVPTQLWLIEDKVATGDVAGVLVHYHRAMQTSRASRDLLSPVLAGAADDPAITRPLARLLEQRPEWWPNFLGDFVARTRSPAALAMVTRSLQLNPAIPVERQRLSTILQRYVALGEYQAGRRLFERVTGSDATPVVDGDFERDKALLPFGWQLTENAAGAGVREAREGAQGRFALTLDGHEGQEMARQLLVLAPGRHVLRLQAGEVRPGFSTPPTVAIRCMPGDVPVIERDLPSTRGAAVLEQAFVVPQGCPAQELIVRGPRATGYVDVHPWIDQVSVTPAGRVRR